MKPGAHPGDLMTMIDVATSLGLFSNGVGTLSKTMRGGSESRVAEFKRLNLTATKTGHCRGATSCSSSRCNYMPNTISISNWYIPTSKLESQWTWQSCFRLMSLPRP